MQPLLSIIIPIYNVEKYLRQCLDSITIQLNSQVEVVLIDDGSTDQSRQIAKEYATKYPENLKLFAQENQGVAVARNFGLKQARGKYIWFIDSDDFIEKAALADLMPYIEQATEEIIHFKLAYVLNEGKAIPQNYDLSNFIPRGPLYKAYLIMEDFNITSKLYLRDFLLNLDLPFPEGVYYEDLIAVYYVLKAKSFYEIPKVYYYYRQRKGSIIHQINNPKQLDIISVIRQLRLLAQKDEKLSVEMDVIEARFYYSLNYVEKMCAGTTNAQILHLERSNSYPQEVFQTAALLKNSDLAAMV